MNNLYGLSLRKDDLTPQLILKLSEVLRYTLYDANVEKLPLEKEIEFIENYIEMERMRYSDKCNISFKVIKLDSDFNKLYIAPLISFVFIENAFKYGLKSNTPFLNIFIEIHKNKVLFKIQNDIDSLSSNINKSGGIGLENVTKRLNLLYPNKHCLTINNDDKSFNILLSINL